MVYVSIFKVWNGDEPPPHCPCLRIEGSKKWGDCDGKMKHYTIDEYEGVHIFRCEECDVFVTWIPDYCSSEQGPVCPGCGGYASRSPCKHCGNDVGMERR